MDGRDKQNPSLFTGIPGSSGQACGTAVALPAIIEINSPLLQYEEAVKLEPVSNNNPTREIERIEAAYINFEKQISQIKKTILSRKTTYTSQQADMLDFQLIVVEDLSIRQQIEQEITENQLTAEAAVTEVYKKQIRRFELLEDENIQARALDLYDILNRLLILLKTQETDYFTNIPDDSIIVVKTITPSQLIALPGERINGLVIERGNPKSHVAILAAAMKIPSVFGCAGIFEYVTSNPCILTIDGDRGIVSRDKDELQETQAKTPSPSKEDQTQAASLQFADDNPIARFELLANISTVEEIDQLLELSSCQGIGLVRTESLFWGSSLVADEEIQTLRYKQIFARAKHDLIIVRTFDIARTSIVSANSQTAGISSLVSSDPERNIAPNMRGLAYSLKHEHLFRAQLRAIIRASAGRSCTIMFPLVLSPSAFSRARKIATQELNLLKQQEYNLPNKLEIGAMIETTQSEKQALKIYDLADFISIGSNDLTAYSAGNLFSEENRRMIRALTARSSSAALNCQDTGKRVIVCGESACDPQDLPIWLSLGIKHFSMAPHKIPQFRIIFGKIRQMPDFGHFV
ncbi:MAG: phosphoenolpyruvate-utilizing N-terminal domain-containing protein [Eubacteriales bacterium]|nr:phosphoenolpyruvate-utilizing N-terminal domain-containing protein [Eubacteriales bacterium]MDD4683253.1 phosphoenolpyruvate-utilizing N-terminal domain-containing protein [Eubacteriales bacterium]